MLNESTESLRKAYFRPLDPCLINHNKFIFITQWFISKQKIYYITFKKEKTNLFHNFFRCNIWDIYNTQFGYHSYYTLQENDMYCWFYMDQQLKIVILCFKERTIQANVNISQWKGYYTKFVQNTIQRRYTNLYFKNKSKFKFTSACRLTNASSCFCGFSTGTWSTLVWDIPTCFFICSLWTMLTLRKFCVVIFSFSTTFIFQVKKKQKQDFISEFRSHGLICQKL